MPEADRFVLHIMAAVAEQEGRAILERTKAALAAANARGVELRRVISERASEQRQAHRGVVVRMVKAGHFAANALPIISELQSSRMSLRSVAKKLNEWCVRTVRGGKW
ncbi:MAG: recombinase family protein [Roseobacter sp.]